MRRLVAALLVALLAFTLVGCGGGGGEPEDQQPAEQDQQTPPPSPQADEDVVPFPDRSALATETFVPFPEGEDVPPAVVERLNTKQAMLILFYDDALDGTDDLRDQVDAVISDNRGMVDLITYDLGKYATVDDAGRVDVDEGRLGGDANAQQTVRFARVLGVDHVPYIIIVDDQGYEIFRNRGFIDAELLERQVQRSSR